MLFIHFSEKWKKERMKKKERKKEERKYLWLSMYDMIQNKFKSWMGLFAFHIALILLGNACIHLFFHRPGEYSRAD